MLISMAAVQFVKGSTAGLVVMNKAAGTVCDDVQGCTRGLVVLKSAVQYSSR